MRRAVLPFLAVSLLGLAVVARSAPARSANTGSLARALEARLAKANLRADRYGIAVITREERPQIAFARGHTRALRPASVAKVLTAAAALDLLGPAYVFQTRVTARGCLGADGTLDGDLVVHGSGDPNLSGRFHDDQPTYVLDRLALAVRQAGIKRVRGAVVLDDGPFDREWVHPSWGKADCGRWYGAPVSGLAFNDGCADVVVRGAARSGVPASVSVPSTVGSWRLENRVKTVAAGRPAVGGLWVCKKSVLRVQGTIAQGATYRFSHPVPDPLCFFGGAFLSRLEAAGVRVERGVRPAADGADRLAGRKLLAVHRSELAPTLEVMNQRSQNLYASLLFKAAGVALEGWGSWASGQHAVSAMLERRGLDQTRATRIVDGSGLSRDNRTTAATVARLLHAFERDLLRGPMLHASLAVPGKEGTLRRRFRSGDLPQRVHAKTGTLGRSGVHALAGYIDGVGDQPGYAFAILLDGVPGGRSLIDDLVGELARR